MDGQEDKDVPEQPVTQGDSQPHEPPAPEADATAEAAPAEETSPTEMPPEAAPPEGSECAKAASEAEIAATVEAILFASDSALGAGKIAQVAELGGQKVVRQAIESLNEKYEQMGCSFRIEEIGGGFQMLTMSQYHDVLGRLFKVRGDSKLSQAALETLAIIAYRQPILRADVEAIRGVASGEVLRGLMEKQLVKIVGRAEVIGRPMLYGTTRRFLEVFGLGSLEDLPRVEELRGGDKAPPTAPTAAPIAQADSPAAAAPIEHAADPAVQTQTAEEPSPPGV